MGDSAEKLGFSGIRLMSSVQRRMQLLCTLNYRLFKVLALPPLSLANLLLQ